MKGFITYCRVSTKMQGRDGLGMESQRDTVRRFVESRSGKIVGEFTEVESGSKTDVDRPQLSAALALCRKTKSTLVVAKLDRLSRNAVFLLQLQQANIDFVCCDAPDVDRFTAGVLALLAQREREMISERTKAALVAAKARGTKLGGLRIPGHVRRLNAGSRKAAQDFRSKIRPIIAEIRSTGVTTLQGVADCLNRRGITTRTGQTTWHPTTVRNVMVG